MEYVVSIKDNWFVHDSFSLEWQKEPPTEEGWYWVADSKYTKCLPVVVKVYKNSWDSDRLSVDIGDMSIKTRVENEGDFWLGPLPVPELPW